MKTLIKPSERADELFEKFISVGSFFIQDSDNHILKFKYDDADIIELIKFAINEFTDDFADDKFIVGDSVMTKKEYYKQVAKEL